MGGTCSEKLKNNLRKAEGMLCGLVFKKLDILAEYKVNHKLLSEDGLFYIGICNHLLKNGYEVVDEVGFSSMVENFKFSESYEKKGGWSTIKAMRDIIDINNANTIIDNFEKWNLIRNYVDKGLLDLDKLYDKVSKMNTNQVYSYMEYELNNVSINSGLEGLDFENLLLTDEELDEIMSGANLGLQFNQKSHILNSMCMGLPKGELNAICGYINEGKTSIAFSNFTMPIVDNGSKALIISTEQRSMVFKMMLLIDVLTTKLNYFKLTRRKLKNGKYTSEDLAKIKEAQEYIKTHYANSIIFLKLYEYSTDIVTKAIKKYAQLGVELVLYDVLKFDSNSEEKVYISLINDSKDLFQCCSKYNVAGLVTLQLAMSTKNKVRQVGMECVSNSKAVFEVMCEAIFIRSVWDDEKDPSEPTYIKPYRLKRDANGKFTGEKEYLDLDPNKQYKIVRLGKSRNDSTDKFLLYSVNFDFNIWREEGLCIVSDKNRY
jgi:replicative DNA helicase